MVKIKASTINKKKLKIGFYLINNHSGDQCVQNLQCNLHSMIMTNNHTMSHRLKLKLVELVKSVKSKLKISIVQETDARMVDEVH